MDEKKAKRLSYKLEVLFGLLLAQPVASRKEPSQGWSEHFNAIMGHDIADVLPCFQADLAFEEAALKVGEQVTRVRADIDKEQKVFDNKAEPC